MRENNAKIRKSKQPKCPNCGASLKFHPETGKLVCEHCDSEIAVSRDANVRERDFDELSAFSTWTDSDVSCYRCSNCGASTVLPKTTLATNCPFCSSPVVIDDEKISAVRPDTVIPFEVSVKDSENALLAWRKKKFFAPRKFRKKIETDSVKGVYLPVWTFDSYTTTAYSGKLGQRRTRTVHRNGKTYTETYIHWFSVSGSIDKVFDDIFVRGNNNVPERYLSQLQPFPQNKYVVFSDEFLAGFIADNYSVDPFTAYTLAREKMKESVRRDIITRYNADVEGGLNMDMRINAKSFKYLMLPVYVAVTKHKQKLYNQYISGVFLNREKKSVKVSGKAPVSPWKICALVALGLGLIALIAVIMHFVDGGGYDPFYEFVKITRFLPL